MAPCACTIAFGSRAPFLASETCWWSVGPPRRHECCGRGVSALALGSVGRHFAVLGRLQDDNGLACRSDGTEALQRGSGGCAACMHDRGCVLSLPGVAREDGDDFHGLPRYALRSWRTRHGILDLSMRRWKGACCLLRCAKPLGSGPRPSMQFVTRLGVHRA